MKLRTLFGSIVLLVVLALIATFAIVWFPSGEGDSNGSPSPASSDTQPRPAPPASGGPIRGDRVSFDEAQRRTPYTIPVPPADVVGSDVQEVWASRQKEADEYKKVYIIYSNGLKISLGGHPNAPPPSDFSQLPDAFREESVGGKTATGKDAFVHTTNIGTQVNVPASLSWWDNKVKITLYHPSLSLQELIRIGEAMPAPNWPSP